MSDWDGRPQNPERDGWHWLLDGNHEPYLLQWSGDNQRWGDYPGTSAADLAEFGIGYLGPCHTPAEVASREAAAWCAGRDAASSHIKPAKVGDCDLAGMALLNAAVSVRGLTPPADLANSLSALVEAARREEREANAAEVDCGCDIREAVLARLESQGEKRASYLCTHADVCCAIQAAAIRARGDTIPGEYKSEAEQDRDELFNRLGRVTEELGLSMDVTASRIIEVIRERVDDEREACAEAARCVTIPEDACAAEAHGRISAALEACMRIRARGDA